MRPRDAQDDERALTSMVWYFGNHIVPEQLPMDGAPRKAVVVGAWGLGAKYVRLEARCIERVGETPHPDKVTHCELSPSDVRVGDDDGNSRRDGMGLEGPVLACRIRALRKGVAQDRDEGR